jgi:uncharacterized protein GlcG (DUF336 family)
MMEHTVPKPSISAAAARKLIDAAERKAVEIGVPMVIAVCDESGILKGFSRMDGAALLSVQIAQDKAYTAVGFGLATHQWHDFIKDDPPLFRGVSNVDRLITFGGGYPLRAGDKIIGGIGVSGGHYSQDMQVAEAALEAIGAKQ